MKIRKTTFKLLTIFLFFVVVASSINLQLFVNTSATIDKKMTINDYTTEKQTKPSFQIGDSPAFSILQNEEISPSTNLEDGIWSWSEILGEAKSSLNDNRKEELVRVKNNQIEIIVRLQDDIESTKSVDEKFSFILQEYGMKNRLNELNSFVVDVPLAKLKDFSLDVQQVETIRYIEPNYLLSVQGTPTDPDYPLQWGPARIAIPNAWDLETGDFSSVLVAIIDTGIDYNHPDLSNQYVSLGYDWVNDDLDPMDDHGHGTHCAGVIAATSNNSIGIAGIANVKIMAEKFLAADGYGDLSDAASSIIHAVDAGADILSNSWGGGGPSALLQEAFAYAEVHDVVIVAAAGNSASNYMHYPSAYPEVISVSAIDDDDTLAYFSNYGHTIELAAPGVNIYSTILTTNGNYGNMSGTSMACPHVAGVAALMKSKFPTWNANQIRERLRDSSEDIGEVGWDEYFGYGLVNAYGAVLDPEPHDLKVEITSHKITGVNKTCHIQTNIKNIGLNDEVDVELQIWVNNSKVTFTTFSSLLVDESKTFDYYLTSSSIGNYNVTAYAVPLASEIKINNNKQTKWVNAVDPNKSVGAIYTHNENHFYSLKDYYQNLGYNFYEIYESFDEALISAFSYLVVSSSGYDWDATERTLIKDFISDGGKIVADGRDLNEDGILALAEDKGKIQDYKTNDAIISSVTNPYHPVMQGVPNVSIPQRKHELSVSGSAIPILFDPIYLSVIGASVSIGLGHLCVLSAGIDYLVDSEEGNALVFENILKWTIPEHNLHVTAAVPNVVQKDISTEINVTIINTGIADESNVHYELLINGVVVMSNDYSTILSGEEITTSYSWTPTTFTNYEINATIIPVTGETLTLDNICSITCHVPDPVITIGFLYPHEEAELNLESFYKNRGYNTFDIYQTITDDLLGAFSYLFVYEGLNSWLQSEIEAIEDFITAGGTFIGLGDGNPSDVSEKLGLKFGIEYLGINCPGSTTTIFDPNHPLIANISSMYLPGPCSELQLSKMATPFLWDSSNTYVIGASADVGAGHFCIIADDLGYYLYNNDNEVFFENILTWQQAEHELILHMNEVHPEFGVPSSLNITVYNSGLNIETNIEIQLWINGTLEAEYGFASIANKELVYFTYEWNPLDYGTYNLTAILSPVSSEQSVLNNVEERITTILSNYYMNTNYTFEWIDPSLGTLLPLGYNSAESVTLPFTFQFYDKNFSTIYVSSNGWMSFDNTYPWQGSNVAYPTTEQDYQYSIGLFWHQLVATGDVYVISLTNPNRIVIAYSNMEYATSVTAGSFEVIFYESGEIVFQYNDLVDIRSPTIGLNYGLGANFYNSFEFGESSIDNFAILFSRDKQLHDLSVDLEVPYSSLTNNLSEISASVTNIGINDETNVQLELWVNDKLVRNSYYSSLGPNQQHISTYDWIPTESGVYNITAYVVINNDESSIINNKLTLLVQVSDPPFVTLTNPNNGGVLSGVIQIQWTATGWETDDLLYSLFLVDGEVLTIIATDLSSTSFYWNTTVVPNGSDYILKITATDGVSEYSDESDVPFEINNIIPIPTTTKQSTISQIIILALPLVITIFQFRKRRKRDSK